MGWDEVLAPGLGPARGLRSEVQPEVQVRAFGGPGFIAEVQVQGPGRARYGKRGTIVSPAWLIRFNLYQSNNTRNITTPLATRRIEMFENLPPAEHIDRAKAKMERVVYHFLYLLELHENNVFIVYSPGLSSQIPESFAANAFNVFQRGCHQFEIVRLCALWDNPEAEKYARHVVRGRAAVLAKLARGFD
jgi:hypothetical protein